MKGLDSEFVLSHLSTRTCNYQQYHTMMRSVPSPSAIHVTTSLVRGLRSPFVSRHIFTGDTPHYAMSQIAGPITFQRCESTRVRTVRATKNNLDIATRLLPSVGVINSILISPEATKQV